MGKAARPQPKPSLKAKMKEQGALPMLDVVVGAVTIIVVLVLVMFQPFSERRATVSGARALPAPRVVHQTEGQEGLTKEQREEVNRRTDPGAYGAGGGGGGGGGGKGGRGGGSGNKDVQCGVPASGAASSRLASRLSDAMTSECAGKYRQTRD